MRKRFLIIVLIFSFALMALPLFGQSTAKLVPETLQGYKNRMGNFYTWLSNPKMRSIDLGTSVIDSLGRITIYVQNKNGTALAEGDACVWDNTAIAAGDTNTVPASRAPALSCTTCM